MRKPSDNLSGPASRVGRVRLPGGAPRLLGRWLPGLVGGGLAGAGLARRGRAGAALVLAGGALAYGGATGRAPLPAWLRSRLPAAEGRGLVVRRAVTIQRPVEELYAFWRDFEHLPRFMGYLRSVAVGADGRSRWAAAGPGGTAVAWDAEVTDERPNELIRWRSLPGAGVSNRGEVRFRPAPAGRGAEVRVELTYEPPAGVLGATLAHLLGRGADRQVRESLRNFKQLMEAGEIPTNDRQPVGDCRGG
jgi:uncharacterized membrane protein